MKISVIVATRSQPQYTNDAILSILNSTYRDFELLIVDQSTNNETEEIAKMRMLSDKRIRYFHIASKGLSKARNYGIKHSTAKIIVFTDSDCQAFNDWLEKIMAMQDELNFDFGLIQKKFEELSTPKKRAAVKRKPRKRATKAKRKRK